jgi:hypothetical protein
VKHYNSISHATSNEDGLEEVTITREAGIFEWSAMMLKAGTTNIGREIVECYVADGTQWRNKATGEIPGHEKQLELFEIKGYLKQQSAAMDRM